MQLLLIGCFVDLTLHIFLWIRACPFCHVSLFLCFWIKGHEAPDWTAALDLKNVLFHVYPDADLLLYLKIHFFFESQEFCKVETAWPQSFSGHTCLGPYPRLNVYEVALS